MRDPVGVITKSGRARVKYSQAVVVCKEEESLWRIEVHSTRTDSYLAFEVTSEVLLYYRVVFFPSRLAAMAL
jgi:hypothetical protein